MYRKSAMPRERLFISASYIVYKTRSSLEPNSVNMLVCMLAFVIRRHLSEKALGQFTVFN